MLGDCLNDAVGRILKNRKSPSRTVNQIDNRATNFYICLYWADFLSQRDPAYKPIFDKLTAARTDIVEEFKKCQGEPVDLGGYYLFDAEKTREAMNPSKTLSAILNSM
jgi:isocitrate dehydrogenase